MIIFPKCLKCQYHCQIKSFQMNSLFHNTIFVTKIILLNRRGSFLLIELNYAFEYMYLFRI